MKETINLWDVESKLYAIMDANGMRSNSTYKYSFSLGNNHVVDVKITNFSNKPLSNHSIIDAKHFVISFNFRKENSKCSWFRIDNESKDKYKSENYLHFHSGLNETKFKEHQKIYGQHTLAEVISIAFDFSYKIISKNFPNEIILDGNGFVGTA